jgi:hypothetical protein
VFDDFVNPQAAKQVLAEFPSVNDSSWINYVHVNERKHGLSDLANFPPTIRSIISELKSVRFLAYLSDLTGIENLIADDGLEGGGLHQSKRGGFLNVHADFTVHPHHRNWLRRVNLLIYLNNNWEESYGSHLELWSKDMTGCVQRITPVFNRCVIFNTDADSFHGHPDKLDCPADVTRKSIALYYYTVEKKKIRVRATNYQARPDDGLKGLWIYLDKQVLATYTKAKSTWGLRDDFASRVLKFLNVGRGRSR